MRVLRVIAVVVAMGIVALLTVPGLGEAATTTMKDVLVVNEPNDPVPTQAVGTTQVAGGVNVTGGTVAVSSGSVTVGNGANAPIPVDITDTPIAVDVQNAAATPQPWQRLISMGIGPGSSFAAASFNVPGDQAVTISRVGLPDLFGADVESISLIEACDFTDGNQGLGGFTAVPIPPRAQGADHAVDHATMLHLSPGSCIQLFVNLANVLPDGTSLSFNVTLSGTSSSAASAQNASPGMSSGQAFSKSLADPAYQNLLQSLGVSAADVKAQL